MDPIRTGPGTDHFINIQIIRRFRQKYIVFLTSDTAGDSDHMKIGFDFNDDFRFKNSYMAASSFVQNIFDLKNQAREICRDMIFVIFDIIGMDNFHLIFTPSLFSPLT